MYYLYLITTMNNSYFLSRFPGYEFGRCLLPESRDPFDRSLSFESEYFLNTFPNITAPLFFAIREPNILFGSKGTNDLVKC